MKLAILDDYSNAAMRAAEWTRLPEHVEITVFDDHLHDEDELVQRLEPFAIVCLMRERTAFPARVLERLPRLQHLASTGYHNASIDLDAARSLGIVVTGTPTISGATPEFVFSLILALARNLVPQADLIRQGGWEYGPGRRLSGATLGVLGLGNVGSSVARLGQAFGMNVIAWSQNLTAGHAASVGVEYRDKGAFFREADVVTIHLKLSERTHNIVGAPELELMKPDAFLVNTARAGNVDNAALVAALESGHLAGAALDVFEIEPLATDDPLRTTDRLLVTPHVAFVTRETLAAFYGDALEAILAVLEGREPPLSLA